jgi:hypothetical protein
MPRNTHDQAANPELAGQSGRRAAVVGDGDGGGRWAQFRARSGAAMGVVLVWWMSLLAGLAAEKPVSEYELKAAILPKLPLFVTWPEKAFQDATTPLRIGVLGTNPFGPHLQAAVRGKRIGNRELSVQMCATTEEAAGCHMVYIASSASTNLSEVIKALAGRGVLTVSDIAGFAELGGMVALTAEDKRIGLRVNPSAFQANGLRADPQLLRIGRLIGPAGSRKN